MNVEKLLCKLLDEFTWPRRETIGSTFKFLTPSSRSRATTNEVAVFVILSGVMWASSLQYRALLQGEPS
jgi:hypothetical protein